MGVVPIKPQGDKGKGGELLDVGVVCVDDLFPDLSNSLFSNSLLLIASCSKSDVGLIIVSPHSSIKNVNSNPSLSGSKL